MAPSHRAPDGKEHMYDELNAIAARTEHLNRLHEAGHLLQAARSSDAGPRPRRVLFPMTVWRAWAKREPAAKRPLARDPSISGTLGEAR